MTTNEPGNPSADDGETEDIHVPLGSLFGVTRTMIFLAVFGTLASAIAMMAYGVLVVFRVIYESFTDRPYNVTQAKLMAIELIELTDLFLFGMALYVVAIGMIQLFIRRIPGLPRWMQVRDLSDLKTQLLDVIIVLLAVSFLAVAISWKGGRDIIYFGIAIGIVIVSLAAYSVAHHRVRFEDRGNPEHS